MTTTASSLPKKRPPCTGDGLLRVQSSSVPGGHGLPLSTGGCQTLRADRSSLERAVRLPAIGAITSTDVSQTSGAISTALARWYLPLMVRLNDRSRPRRRCSAAYSGSVRVERYPCHSAFPSRPSAQIARPRDRVSSPQVVVAVGPDEALRLSVVRRRQVTARRRPRRPARASGRLPRVRVNRHNAQHALLVIWFSLFQSQAAALGASGAQPGCGDLPRRYFITITLPKRHFAKRPKRRITLHKMAARAQA